MTIQERQEILLEIYGKALRAGLCHNKKQFAEKLGIDRTSLYSAMGGDAKSCTESLISKVVMWAKVNRLAEEPQQPNTPSFQEIVIPAATAVFYQNLSESLRNMSETVRMQQELISQLQLGVKVIENKKKIG